MKKIVILLNGTTDGYINYLKESTTSIIYIDKNILTEEDKRAILQLKEEVHAERLEWKLIQKVSDSISNFSRFELVLIDCASFTPDGLAEVQKNVRQTYGDACTSFEIKAMPLQKVDSPRFLFYISGTTSFQVLAELLTKKHAGSSVIISDLDKAADKLFIPAVNAESINLIVKRTPGFDQDDMRFCSRASEAGLPGPFSIQMLEITSDEPESRIDVSVSNDSEHASHSQDEESQQIVKQENGTKEQEGKFLRWWRKFSEKYLSKPSNPNEEKLRQGAAKKEFVRDPKEIEEAQRRIQEARMQNEQERKKFMPSKTAPSSA